MSIDVSYRYDPGSGEAHHTVLRDVGGTSRRALAQALIHDACDLGSGATGNVLSTATDNTLGTFISCDGKTFVVFKVEYSAADVTRRFRLMFKDKGTTALYLPGPMWEPAQVGAQGGPTGGAVRVTNAYHAESGIFPVYGFKEVTLWLLDGLSTPTVNVWGAAV